MGLLDTWLSSSDLAPHPILTFIPVELTRSMFHSSAPATVVSKAAGLLDSARRSNFSLELHGSLVTSAVVAEMCQLAGRA